MRGSGCVQTWLQVAALAEQHAADPEAAFAAIHLAAARALGAHPPHTAPPPRRRVPRLSEPWFC